MTNLDFSTKELVDSFAYSTANFNRERVKTFRHHGRWYSKYGTEQVVTAVGNIFKVKNTSTGKHVKVLMVGISKQSTYERVNDRRIGESVAAERSFMDPQIVMIVPDEYDYGFFRSLMSNYIDYMRLQFMKTNDEIKMKNVDTLLCDDRDNINFDD